MRKQGLLNRQFLVLWLAQISSQLAFNMMNFIFIIFVYEKTLSNTAVSGVVISFTLPALFFGMLAGVYVDRRNKKSILLLTNLLRGLLTLTLYFTKDVLFSVFLISFLTSGITQFFIPAEAATIPRVVGKKRLVGANSLFTITLFTSIFAGYIIAGPLLKLFGFGNAFLIGTLFYFLASLFISYLPKTGSEKNVALSDFLNNHSVKTAVSRVREVFITVKRLKNTLFAILLLTLSQGIIAVLATLLPGYARTVLGIETTDTSLIILAPTTLGIILGAVLLLKFGRKAAYGILVNLGIITSGIIIILLSQLSRLPTLPTIGGLDAIVGAVILVFILGLADSIIIVISNATLQASGENLIGGLYGIVVSLSAAVAFLPVIIVGGLADILGVKSVLIILGILILGLGIFKSLKEYAFKTI